MVAQGKRGQELGTAVPPRAALGQRSNRKGGSSTRQVSLRVVDCGRLVCHANTNDSEPMSNGVLVSFSLLSAITLALAYHPILAKLSLGLVSPYAKADVTKRLLAAAVDGMLIASVLYRSSESLFYVVAGAAYLLLRDAMSGRSVGKFVCGLDVINLGTGRPCGSGASVSRNVLFLLPGANVIAAFLEAATIVRDPQGQRLGDRFALTQVVEGFGAKDLVTGVQQWLLVLIEQLGDKVRKPGRVPVKVQHRMEIRLAGRPSNTRLERTAEKRGCSTANR